MLYLKYSNVYRSSCKVPVIRHKNLMKLEFFFDKLSKNSQISNFMKICPGRLISFHADRRTERHDEANIRFSRFSEKRLIRTPYQIGRNASTLSSAKNDIRSAMLKKGKQNSKIKKWGTFP